MEGGWKLQKSLDVLSLIPTQIGVFLMQKRVTQIGINSWSR